MKNILKIIIFLTALFILSNKSIDVDGLFNFFNRNYLLFMSVIGLVCFCMAYYYKSYYEIYEDKIEDLKERNEDLHIANDNLNDRLKNIQNDNSQIENLENQNDYLKDELQKSNIAVKEFAEMINNLDLEKTKLTNDYNILLEVYEDLKTENEELTENKKVLLNDIESANERCLNAIDELSSIKTQLELLLKSDKLNKNGETYRVLKFILS